MTRHPDSETGSSMPAVPAQPGHGTDVPLAVTHAEMNAADERGEAALLAESIPWLVRYRDAWWVVYEHGWLRIVDGLGEIDLDHLSARLTAADATATSDTMSEGVPLPGAGVETAAVKPGPDNRRTGR